MGLLMLLCLLGCSKSEPKVETTIQNTDQRQDSKSDVADPPMNAVQTGSNNAEVATPEQQAQPDQKKKVSAIENKPNQQTLQTRKKTARRPTLHVPSVFNDSPRVDGATKFVLAPEQELKNATVLLIAMEPDIRAMELIKFIREYLTPEQYRAAVKLIVEHDGKFQDLKRRRAAILEKARAEEAAREIHVIHKQIVEYADKMRSLAYQKIMTEEQRQQRRRDLIASGELKE